MIIHEIEKRGLELSKGKTIKKAVCGSAFTAVQLSDGSAGISFRYPGLEPCCYAGTMEGRPASDLVKLIVDGNLQETSVGMATINALTSQGREDLPGGSLYESIELRSSDVVGVIGNFGKFLDPIGQNCKKLMVFELQKWENTYPSWMEPLYLPECDIVVITGSALLNKTIDSILEYSTNAREIVLMGPTVPYLPDIFKAHGVTVLSGSEVIEKEKSLICAMEGGNGPDMVRLTRKFSVRIN